VTRPWRTPLSIWVIVAIWTIAGLSPVFQMGRIDSIKLEPVMLGVIAASVGFAIYHAVALLRLSLWPVLTQLVGVGLGLMSHSFAEFRASYSWMLMLAPMAIYLACILPHWRKMNWSLFGRPYRPIEDQVEVFA
jgi:hypothetical protein